MEGNIVQYGSRAVIAEVDIFKSDVAFNWRKRDGSLRIAVFCRLAQDFLETFEAGQRFCKLGPDLHDLHDRRDQESHEHRISEELTDSERASENLPRPDIHNNCADHAEQYAGGESHDRSCGQTSQNVVQ